MGIERLRICTADEAEPFREVDLADCAILKENIPSNYDTEMRTLNGSEVIFQRGMRRNIVLDIDGLPESESETLDLISRERREVFFEGNIGGSTRQLLPFQNSKDPIYGAGAAYSRSSIATYLAEDGKIYEVASGIPRFEACKIGNGILLEPASTNYFYPSHGASGDTIFTGSSGTPTISWESRVTSRVDGHAGVIKVFADDTEKIKKTVSGLTDSAYYSIFIDVQGVGQARLVIGNTDGGTDTGATESLSMDGWTRLTVENVSPAATQTTLDVEIEAKQALSIIYIAGCQLETGTVNTGFITTTTAAVTRVIDQFYVSTHINPAEGSIAFWIRWPRFTGASTPNRQLFYVAANFYAHIVGASGTPYFRVGSGVGVSTSLSFSAGDLVHLAFVWKEDYAAVIANGVQAGVQTSNVRDINTWAAVSMHYSESTPATVIDDLRIDEQYVEWRTSEGGLYPYYSDAAQLELIKKHQGRFYRIKSLKLTPKPYDHNYLDGGLVLRESSSDEDQIIGEQ